MKRIGICFFCHKNRLVRNHHLEGYFSEKTVPTCYSCDQKEHYKNKRECGFNLPLSERQTISARHCQRRKRKGTDYEKNEVYWIIENKENPYDWHSKPDNLT